MVNYPRFMFLGDYVVDVEDAYLFEGWANSITDVILSAKKWASENLLTVVPAAYRHAEPLTTPISMKGVVLA